MDLFHKMAPTDIVLVVLHSLLDTFHTWVISRQIQQLGQLPYISKFDAVVTPLASFLGAPLECSSKEQEKSESGLGQDVWVGNMQDFHWC